MAGGSKEDEGHGQQAEVPARNHGGRDGSPSRVQREHHIQWWVHKKAYSGAHQTPQALYAERNVPTHSRNQAKGAHAGGIVHVHRGSRPVHSGRHRRASVMAEQQSSEGQAANRTITYRVNGEEKMNCGRISARRKGHRWK